MLLAALGIGFGLVLSGQLAGDWSPDSLSARGASAWWVGAALAVASVAMVAMAVWPRFHAADLSGGIAYWGHVASYGSVQEFSEALEGNAMAAPDRTVHQLWHLSRLVRRKYAWIRRSMCVAGVAVLIIGAALFFG
ncbi:Pycsar system effector family protein [Cryobacterium tepidiphilum]|nr:Pycsar system effector family protein [Cryobacterium tepidiphilum]